MLKFSTEVGNKVYSGIIINKNDELYTLGIDTLKDSYEGVATVSFVDQDEVVRISLVNQFKVSGSSIVIYVVGDDLSSILGLSE